MLTPAGLRLRMGIRAPQTPDSHMQEQLILVHQRILAGGTLLAACQGHPVMAVLGVELVPLLQALLVDEARLGVNEINQFLIAGPRSHQRSCPSNAIAATHARN